MGPRQEARGDPAAQAAWEWVAEQEAGGPGPGWPQGWGPGPEGELRAEGWQEGEHGAGDADLPLGVGGRSAM